MSAPKTKIRIGQTRVTFSCNVSGVPGEIEMMAGMLEASQQFFSVNLASLDRVFEVLKLFARFGDVASNYYPVNPFGS